MMVFTADMIVSSQVNLELVTAARDNIVAEYMSKSGYNLALFLLSIDYGIDLFKQAQMKTPPQDGLGDIWAMVNDIPIGAETLEMVTSMQEAFNLNTISDGDVIKQLQMFQGEFTVTVSDEAAKINVNYCAAGGATTQCKQMRAMLSALFNCPIEKTYLESKDVDPSVLIAKIKDWVDSDKRADPKSGISNESDPYQRLDPPYRTKKLTVRYYFRTKTYRSVGRRPARSVLALPDRLPVQKTRQRCRRSRPYQYQYRVTRTARLPSARVT